MSLARAAAAACAVALAGCAHAAARDFTAGAPLVLLDPGHSPASPGAKSARGTDEVAYNDAFAALLAPRLAAAGFRVEWTRRPGEELDLDGRVARAAALRPWLLLSLHHDSAQERYLEPAERDGRPAVQTTRPIRGFSLFVSGENARFDESRRVASALGAELLALGRAPSLHHAEPIPGEGRPLLDPRLGVYRFDGLKVLRLAPCPAVLVELGVLPDPEDEAYVSDPARQAALADAVVRALVEVRGAGR
jgi:N-acetylmuramoyl-L-alanine amidase